MNQYLSKIIRLAKGLTRLPWRLLNVVRKIEGLNLPDIATSRHKIEGFGSLFLSPILGADKSVVTTQLTTSDSLLPIFNPSIIKIDVGFLCLARESTLVNYHESLYTYESAEHKTINHVFILDNQLRLMRSTKLDDSLVRYSGSPAEAGIEDCRLFVHNGDVWGVGAATKKVGGHFYVRQIIFRLSNNKIVEFYYGPQINGRIEKNWVPIENEYVISLLYSVNSNSLIKLEDGCFTVPALDFSRDFNLRGGSPLVRFGDYYLGIAHSPPQEFPEIKIYYVHYFVVFDSSFRHGETSEPFFLRRKGIEFVCGLHVDEEWVYISYGVADRAAEIMKIPMATIKKYLVLSNYVRSSNLDVSY